MLGPPNTKSDKKTHRLLQSANFQVNSKSQILAHRMHYVMDIKLIQDPNPCRRTITRREWAWREATEDYKEYNLSCMQTNR